MFHAIIESNVLFKNISEGRQQYRNHSHTFLARDIMGVAIFGDVYVPMPACVKIKSKLGG